jgi:hypothetical protein
VRDDGQQFAPLAVDWPSPDRVAWQREESVAPGAVGTFTFQVRAPAALGQYEIPLRLVVDGVTWLDDEPVIARLQVLAWNDAPDLLVAEAFTFLAARALLVALALIVFAAALAVWFARHARARGSI